LEVHPQSENYWGHVDPIGQRSVYDEAKRFAEALTMAYHRYHNINTGIVRIFNTYGPRMRLDDGRVIPNFIQQALRKESLTVYGDGSQTRSFCYVDDLVEGIIKLLLSDEHQPFNIGNPDEISILELAESINNKLSNKAKLSFLKGKVAGDDPLRRKPDISRVENILDWKPKTSLINGLDKTIPYFKEKLKL
jgi:dTDP-glucose 4,6-dehydratase